MPDADTAHAPANPGDEHSDDGHGHEEPAEPLGAVDLKTWGVAIGGGAIGLLVALAMFAASNG